MQADLSKYNNSWYKPGANASVRFCWYFVNILFFINPLNPFSGVKVFLLRMFGAKLGKGVIIKPSVNIKYPWHLSVGNYVWIGEHAWIDNLTKITIGNNVCISQGAMLLTGNHNYKKPTFFKQDNYLRNEFEKMILDCQKNKCKVILVYAPEYSASKHLIKNKKEIINYYNQVSKKYNIEFLDYSDGEISTNKLLFYNNSHLNTVGADIFTKQLTSDLNKIL